MPSPCKLPSLIAVIVEPMRSGQTAGSMSQDWYAQCCLQDNFNKNTSCRLCRLRQGSFALKTSLHQNQGSKNRASIEVYLQEASLDSFTCMQPMTPTNTFLQTPFVVVILHVWFNSQRTSHHSPRPCIRMYICKSTVGLTWRLEGGQQGAPLNVKPDKATGT